MMRSKSADNQERISPELLKKIRRIHFKSRLVASSMLAGQHKSVFKGSGIEFEEVRNYISGDDVKSIDWKVSARMGRPFVKRYREERELNIMLLIDMSASGYFGTYGRMKRDTICEISAILAFNAIQSNDKIGALFFTDTVEKYIPPGKGGAHVFRIIKDVLSFAPEGKGTDISKPISYLENVCSKRTVVFLISDFMSDGYSKVLQILGVRYECICIVISDPGEFSLPSYGLLSFLDPETGREMVVDCRNKKMREQFINYKLKQYGDRIDVLKKSGIDHIEIRTSESVTTPLIRYFKSRGKR